MQRCLRCVLNVAQAVLNRIVLVRPRELEIGKLIPALVICWGVFSLPLQGETAAGMQATTSKSARREAIRSIPLKQIEPKYRQAVQRVMSDTSLYRRLPTQMVDCNPELFTFLAQNPEMLVEIWRYLGITKVELQRTGAKTFRITDNAGTTGKLVLVEQSCDRQAQNRIVMYAEGAYEGKPFKQPVRAQCVLLLRSGSYQETNERNFVVARLDSFTHIDRTSIELFAKAVHPFVGKTADRNFGDTLQFISNFSHEAETRPTTIEQLVSRLPGVSPARQDQLIQIAYQSGAEDDRDAAARPSSIRRVARVDE